MPSKKLPEQCHHTRLSRQEFYRPVGISYPDVCALSRQTQKDRLIDIALPIQGLCQGSWKIFLFVSVRPILIFYNIRHLY